MKMKRITSKDVKVKFGANDDESYIKGTVGKYYLFYANVDIKTIFLSLKRYKVNYFVLHRKKRDDVPGRRVAVYDRERGIQAKNKQTKQMIRAILLALEWYRIC